MDELHRLETYDYALPDELIAQEPLPERDASRLLVVERATGRLTHSTVRELPSWLRTGDCLVLNNSRVVPAKLSGVRTQTGGRWEGLFLGRTDSGWWKLIGQTRGHLQLGETVTIVSPQCAAETLAIRLIERGEDGVWLWEPQSPDDAWTLLGRFGEVPLPPYISRMTQHPDDRERYQTVYAATPGSVAAPTAGLHFTPELLESCRERGVDSTTVTLHVGLGTFRPVSAADIRQHVMHREWCELPESTARRLAAVQEQQGRIVAVGTTSLRTLETARRATSGWQGWQGESQLFISPPYEFRAVDVLLTNFHLPKSTLLMLVVAFAGLELTCDAYRTAITERYRFFSYGDAMLIV